MYLKIFSLVSSLYLLTACQMVSPVPVDDNGVRKDVAKWINQQALLSMQQKTSLAQLSKAQQKLSDIDNIQHDQKIAIAKQNSIAMHCAHLYLKENTIDQLQQQLFGEDKQRILDIYNQQFPKLKIDVNSIQCE